MLTLNVANLGSIPSIQYGSPNPLGVIPMCKARSKPGVQVRVAQPHTQLKIYISLISNPVHYPEVPLQLS